MDIAIPNLPFGTFIERAFKSSLGPKTVTLPADGRSSEQALVAGHVDIALIPTLTALKNSDLFDVFPAFALSTWGFPYARLHLPGGLSSIGSTLHVPSSNPQEAFLASIVLQEHYRTRVSLVIEDGPIAPDLQQHSCRRICVCAGCARPRTRVV